MKAVDPSLPLGTRTLSQNETLQPYFHPDGDLSFSYLQKNVLYYFSCYYEKSVGTIKIWVLCSAQGHAAECDLKALMLGLMSYRTSLRLLLPLSAGANIEFLSLLVLRNPLVPTRTELVFVQEMLKCVHFQFATFPVVNEIKLFCI